MEKYALSILLFQRKHFKKFFNIMRISILFLFVSILASYASNVNSQTAKVNITSTRMTIGTFIRQVEKETGYMFVYNKEEIDANKTISLKKGKNTVADCLNTIFVGSGVSFVFDDMLLIDIIKKLELYYDVSIIVKNTKLGNFRYTGKFRQRDGVEGVLKKLQIVYPFTYTKDDDRNQILLQ